jgi:hypothetical protein
VEDDMRAAERRKQPGFGGLLRDIFRFGRLDKPK